MTKKKGRSRFIFCCLAPAVILFVIFMIIPTIDVFKMSLYKWGGYTAEKTFVGFDNFKTLLQSDKFYQAFQNTVLLIVVLTIVTFSMAIIFAAILTREKIKGQTFFRVVFYIPNILSVVVISAIFSAIYDPNQGLLNSFLNIFRGQDGVDNPILWLGSQKIVIYSIIIAMVWQAIGYYMVMYMASMAAIPPDYYEAASLDGATEIQMFFKITFPLIWSNIRTTLTFYIISTINLSFLFVQIMTNGGPNGNTEVALNYMYKQAYTNGSYGYGMAIGVVIFLFSFILAGIVNKITDREVYEF